MLSSGGALGAFQLPLPQGVAYEQVAYGVSGSGIAAGYVYGNGSDGLCCALRATVWPTAGGVTPLKDFGYEQGAMAYDAADDGTVVGYSYEPNLRATIWRNGEPTVLAAPLPSDMYGTYAWGISDAGSYVVGSVPADIGGICCYMQAARWTASGDWRNLGTLPGVPDPTSEAREVNNAGQAVGWAYTDMYRYHAVLWEADGTPRDLGTLPGGSVSEARAINNAGAVTGTSNVLVNGQTETHAFVWTEAGGMRDLGTPPDGSYSQGWDINDDGEVTGYANVLVDGQYSRRFFLWTESTGYRVLPAPAGASNQFVNPSVSNTGFVVGNVYAADMFGAYRWNVEGGDTSTHAEPDHAPTVSFVAPMDVREGQPVAFVAQGSDADLNSTLSYAWDFDGDGVTDATTPEATWTFADDGHFDVALTVSDGGLTSSASASVDVRNVAPVVDAGADLQATARTPVTLTAALSDAGSRDGDWRYSIDWGNGVVTSGVASAQGSSAIAESYSYGAAGTYTATITAADKDGAESRDQVTVTVVKAQGMIVLGDLSQRYSGSPRTPSATTSPAGLAVHFSFSRNGAPVAQPVDAGPYVVTAVVDDPAYAGSATAMMEITRAPAAVVLSGLTGQTYDGTPRYARATTTPAGLQAVVVYSTLDGGAVAAPTSAGTYNVVATIVDANYFGTGSGRLVIDKATPRITWNAAGLTYGEALGPAQLNATVAGVNGAPLAGVVTYTPAAGTYLNVGPQTLRVQFTPADKANYADASGSTEISVLYTTAAGRRFLAPLEQKSAVRIGSTIPVKLELYYADGVTEVRSAVLGISAVKISTPSGDPAQEITSSMPPDDGSIFRVTSGGQYHFNLSTAGWTQGTYRITAWLDDGTKVVQDVEARSR